MRAAHLSPDGLHLLRGEVEGPGVSDGIFEGGRGVEAVRGVEGVGGDVGGCTGEVLAEVEVVVVVLFFWGEIGGDAIGQVVEWCVEEDITVGRSRGYQVEGGIPGSHDRDRTVNDLLPIEVREIPFITQRRQLLHDMREGLRPIRLEIDEQDERLRRVCIKHPVGRLIDDRVERRNGVLPVEDLHQRIDVHAPQGAFWGEC